MFELQMNVRVAMLESQKVSHECRSQKCVSKVSHKVYISILDLSNERTKAVINV